MLSFIVVKLIYYKVVYGICLILMGHSINRFFFWDKRAFIHSFLNKINEYKWNLYLQQQVSWSLFSMTMLMRPIKMRQYSCLFDVYMDCCSLSVTGPQTSTSDQAILIKRYSKHYRHNVKSPYECIMDQNGVHGYYNKELYCHWPSTSDIKTLVCSKYLRKIYSVSVTFLLHTEQQISV